MSNITRIKNTKFMHKRVGLVFDEETHCFQSYNQGYRKTGNN